MKAKIFLLLTIIFLAFFSNSCETDCSNCQIKFKLIDLPQGAQICYSYVRIGEANSDQMEAIKQGQNVKLPIKMSQQTNPNNFDPLATFDVGCDKGVILSSFQIGICNDNHCPGKTAIYDLSSFMIWSTPFSTECDPTIIIDFDWDLSYVGCY